MQQQWCYSGNRVVLDWYQTMPRVIELHPKRVQALSAAVLELCIESESHITDTQVSSKIRLSFKGRRACGAHALMKREDKKATSGALASSRRPPASGTRTAATRSASRQRRLPWRTWDMAQGHLGY